MNTKQIDLVLDLSRTLNYRKTAENMFISQPALTHQINVLEAELGVSLFSRSSRSVSLTSAGEYFCKEMSSIHARTKNLMSKIRNFGDSYSDTLRLGLSPNCSSGIMPIILRRFAAQHPHIMLDPQQISGSARLDSFLRDELDIIFYVNSSIPSSASISQTQLFRSRIYCILPVQHPLAQKHLITAADLAGERVLLNHGNGPEALLDAQNALLQSTDILPQLCHDKDAAMLWVEALGGAALMPGFAYETSGRFAWVPYDWEETIPCGVAWHTDDHRPYVESFIQLAQEVFSAQEAAGAVL